MSKPSLLSKPECQICLRLGDDDFRAGGYLVHQGKPMARLAPIAAPVRKKRLGLLKGKIKVPDDFNAPLDDETLSTFEGR
jgi:hypothetical protein